MLNIEDAYVTPYRDEDRSPLAQEHGVLLRHYGELQRRCSAQARSQRREIEQLQGQIMRLRAEVILRDSALAWEREDRQKLPDTAADSPAHRPGALHAPDADPRRLEHNLRGAELVICQTGCVSHGWFWRAGELCKRTGQTCVLVQRPQALDAARSPDGQAERPAPVSLCEKDTQ